MLLDLDLRQFRCHRHLRFSFQPGWNLILGANGEGKSSLLEAIYYVGRLKSYRTNQTRELIQWQQQGFQVILNQELNNRVERLAVRWENGARHCQIDQQPIDRIDEFWGRLPLVLLTSEDQLLVKGPALRRLQWLDSLVAYRDSSHLIHVQRYNIVLRQRNAWLRQGSVDLRLGEALTQQLTEMGMTITRDRSQMLNDLHPCLNALSLRLLPEDRKIAIEYRPSFSFQDPPDWMATLKNEQRLGRTLSGPHRDEIILTLRDKSLSRFGSEGEQRMGALLLRLTELHAIHDIRQEWPLLLLDDVLNPLDATRKTAWTQEIPPQVQVVLATTTWPSDFATPEKWRAWELQQGILKEL